VDPRLHRDPYVAALQARLRPLDAPRCLAPQSLSQSSR
jgi:hypothetical protein